MIVKTRDCMYDVYFKQVQIEITGNCNMNCKHCRAKEMDKQDMSLQNINKILQFCTKNGKQDLEIVLSGGEPFLYKDLKSVFSLLEKYNIKKLVITTNGSISIKPYLPYLKQFDTVISISLDSIKEKEHDDFREYKGAFKKAISTLEFLQKNHIKTNIRMSILPNQIDKLEEVVDFIYKLGVKRFSISSIIPTGRALEENTLCMSKDEKKRFIEKIIKLEKEYREKGMILVTSDPLKNIYQTEENNLKENVICFSGCTAGIDSININTNGDITPCAMLGEKILNINNLEKEEIEKEYCSNEIIKSLVSRNLKGKCEKCKLKYQCGGCRTRAKNKNGCYLEEDSDCWI